ncbi:LOW QUALITY PROTEIN: hypothetical protein PHPALM_30508 [Phytophthora palmivora]|uniref:PiggyBac transposable element-derived protein domain-containing protein n=1 Tax=Phytophthora palmivora TaxID=4796 RepID=A0A2P4X4Y9_9STRA|nr:LOW QUALITY PROTEIN: hypothetical protein PHPALM_30508 [Phytophthora palmivora]
MVKTFRMVSTNHKWGSNTFLTCCTESAYCLCAYFIYAIIKLTFRYQECCTDIFEIYVVKTMLQSERRSVPQQTYLQNFQLQRKEIGWCSIGSTKYAGATNVERYLVITDTFYTCTALAIQLLGTSSERLGDRANCYVVASLGFSKQLTPNGEKRPRGKTKGAHMIATCKRVPQLQSCLWYDNRPAPFLCTGGSAVIKRVARIQGANQVEGDDIHDPLHLRRYSILLPLRTKKYYKSLFFGLVDMAVVNAYIVYKGIHNQRQQTPPLSHT